MLTRPRQTNLATDFIVIWILVFYKPNFHSRLNFADATLKRQISLTSEAQFCFLLNPAFDVLGNTEFLAGNLGFLNFFVGTLTSRDSSLES